MALPHLNDELVYYYVDRDIDFRDTVSAKWPITYCFEFVQPQAEEQIRPKSLLQTLKLQPLEADINPQSKEINDEIPNIEEINQIGMGTVAGTSLVDFEDESEEIFGVMKTQEFEIEDQSKDETKPVPIERKVQSKDTKKKTNRKVVQSEDNHTKTHKKAKINPKYGFQVLDY